MDNKFPLQGLEVLDQYNQAYFKDLPSNLQAKIEDKKLLIYILQHSTPIAVVYELFDRLNTGGTPLNRQEVRHCLFKGKSTQLLKDLSETPIFRQAIGEGIAPTRMKDREIILRFFAFYLQDYRKHYQGDLSDFVERAMSLINRMEDAEIDKLRQVFLRVMKQTLDLFGSKNFRVSSSGSRGFINTSVFESVCLFFAHRQADSFKGHEAQIQQNYQQLLAHPNYLESVRFSTASKAKVNQRFELVEQILGTGIA